MLGKQHKNRKNVMSAIIWLFYISDFKYSDTSYRCSVVGSDIHQSLIDIKVSVLTMD